ncbi:MAG: 50S ribosomal protein L25 [Chlamydiae bacterium]|nr:50S ribosomal protein L25 [Chlamydiota bacterium]MBI3277556.1 50S ribosomal protein L25 [Chlamydiota bacterium]
MSEMLALGVEERVEKGKSVKRLRKSGLIPAVIYGEGKPGISVKVEAREFTRAIKGHSIENLIFSLNLSNEKNKKGTTALVRDVQIDPLKDCVLHVDFLQVSMKKKLRTRVRIESKGEPMGVSQQGGILECTLREIEIECFPLNIPEALVVDVSQVGLGQSFFVRDIEPPEGVTILTAPDISVFSVAIPKVEEEVPKEGEKTEPEVIAKGKEPAPGEAAEGAQVAAQKKEAPAQKEAEKKKEK